jgi:hypothetical protein
MRRHKMSRSHSKKLFSHTAARTHKKNLHSGNPMRGGIRL